MTGTVENRGLMLDNGQELTTGRHGGGGVAVGGVG